MSLTIEPFTIAVPDADLDDLRARLTRTRLSDQIPGAGWDYGTERDYLAELVAYWRDEYDWRRAEKALNAFDNYLTEIDGTRVHFIHARSPEPDALPLVITHGWPGSVVEFLEIIRPLADPRSHGGDPADAFHVVCPAIPGYGFSGPTHERGWGPRRIAQAWATLMAELGYARYGAQGGDWGSMISTQLALVDAEHLAGLHLNMIVAPPPADLDFDNLREDEQAALASYDYYARVDSGYSKIQGTKPQTIGYALDDSPAGLAAWIVEKFRTWSDCDGDVERRFTKDQLLDNVMFYWLTGTAHSAGRLYYEAEQTAGFVPDTRVEVPVGFAAFPKEIIRSPRHWAEIRYDVRRWTEMPKGGHFAAFEEPQLLVDDIRAFFNGFRIPAAGRDLA
jgi:pimeloyl-ACP methyl ester carboxylesterase